MPRPKKQQVKVENIDNIQFPTTTIIAPTPQPVPKSSIKEKKSKIVKVEDNISTTMIDFPTTTTIDTTQYQTKGKKSRQKEKFIQEDKPDPISVSKSSKKLVSTQPIKLEPPSMIDSEEEVDEATFLLDNGIDMLDFDQDNEGELLDLFDFGEGEDDSDQEEMDLAEVEAFDFYQNNIIDGNLEKEEEETSATNATNATNAPFENVTSLNEIMNSQGSFTTQHRNIEKANKLAKIHLELSLEDLDTLANHFADTFIIMVNDHMSNIVSKELMAASENENVGGALKEYSCAYQKQSFDGFSAGKMHLSMDLETFTTENLDINSTMVTKSMTGDHSLNIDNLVNKIDLVAEHIGNRRDNRRQLALKHREKRLKGKTDSKWFDLPKTRVTKGMKEAWAVLQNKAQLTSGKQFIRVEKSKLPAYSHVGTIIDGDVSGLNRLTNKQKKRTLTEQFLDEARQSGEVRKRFKATLSRYKDQYGSGRQYTGQTHAWKKK